MLELFGTFCRLGPKKILVAGDFLFDTYTMGKARRISPEAPVAVIHAQKQRASPGGAGNVLLNLVSMGAKVSALGRVGNDAAGKQLVDLLANEKVDVRGLVQDPDFQTPVKNRIIADNQQILRIDHEEVSQLNSTLERQIIALFPELLQDVQVLAISDYGKGFLTLNILKELIAAAKARNIFIITDPKGIDFTRYSGVDLLKPNQSEAYAAALLPSTASLDEVAEKLFRTINIPNLMITRSEAGISLFEKHGARSDFTVQARQVKDVTGAGDTVLAVMACSCANSLTLASAIELSNIAAGIAIEQAGCARVNLSQLARRLLQTDVSNKVFDASHLLVLKAALEETPCLITTLPGNRPPTPYWVKQIQEKKQASASPVLVVIEKGSICSDTIGMLASLQPIDFIILNGDATSIQSIFTSTICQISDAQEALCAMREKLF